MKKLIVAGIIAIMAVGTAYADPYRRDRGHSYRGSAVHYNGGPRSYPRHVHPHRHVHQHRYVHQHRNNYAPWIAGAVGLGVLGAIVGGAYYYDNYVCYRRVVGYNEWGNPIIRRYCE